MNFESYSSSGPEFYSTQEAPSNQTHLAVYSLGVALLLQVTICNPLLASAPLVAYGGAVAGCILALGGLYEPLHLRFREIKELPAQRRITAVAAPLIFAIVALSLGIGMYVLGHLSSYCLRSALLWLGGALFAIAYDIQTSLIKEGAGFLPEHISDPESEIERSEVELIKLERGVEKLTAFLCTHQDLLLKLNEHIQKHPEQIARCPPLDFKDLIPNFDPHNPWHRSTVLGLKIRRVKFDLSELQRVIVNNKELYALFRQHLSSQPRALIAKDAAHP